MDRSSVRLDLLVHDRGVVCGNDIGDAITADRRQRVVERLTILIIADFMNRKQRVADVALQSICAVALRSLSVDFEDGMIRPDMIALIHHLVERAIFRKCRDEVREAGILDVDLIDRDPVRYPARPDARCRRPSSPSESSASLRYPHPRSGTMPG